MPSVRAFALSASSIRWRLASIGEHVGPLAHGVDERTHGLGADRHLAAVADGDGPGAVHDGIEDQLGLVLEPLGLGAFEAGADEIAVGLEVVGDAAVLLGVGADIVKGGGMRDEAADARATNAQPWEPPTGMLKRQCPECRYFFAAPAIEPEPGCSAPIALLRAPGRCCHHDGGTPAA